MDVLPQRIEIPSGDEISLYNGLGYCRYIDHLGSDLRALEAARISYKSPSKGKEQDVKLLRYLITNKHTSPLEQNSITFNIKMPIFIMRQLVRHRTARLNEWSGRYSELEDEWFVPTEWRKQDTKNKQGSLESEDLDHALLTEKTEEICRACYDHYQWLLSKGVAKELARVCLPLNMMTEIYFNIDLHNLMHLLKLRLDGHAQKEIRELAQAMAHYAEIAYPESMKIFKEIALNEK